MKSRRKAREAALRVLYEVEIAESDAGEASERAFAEMELAPDLSVYSAVLIRGILDARANLDQNISGLLQDYDFNRLAAIDRNILRIGAYELLFVTDVPPAVCINEAIELAKQYSTAESGRFVNGVLGKLLQHSPKASWVPPSVEVEQVLREAAPAPEPELVDVDSEEARAAQKFGQWKLRTEED